MNLQSADYQEFDSWSIGPFTTVRRLRRTDGSEVVYSAWHHRKGHGLIDATSPRSPVSWWAPDRLGWWIAILFMIGSSCFAVASMLAMVDILGSFVAGIYFLGSLFFTAAAYLQFYEAVNEGDDIEGRGRTRQLVGVRRASLGWWASAVQLIGTLAFNLSTFAPLRDLGVRGEELLVWSPDVIGSVCFLVSSLLVVSETYDPRQGLRLCSQESRMAAVNMVGSVAFAISAVAAYVVPSTGQLLSLTLVNVFTCIGGVCFFVGAAMLIPAMRPEPVAA